MENNKRKVSININLLDILGGIFIGLKIGGAISWSWIWVLAPFWVVWLLALIITIIIAIMEL